MNRIITISGGDADALEREDDDEMSIDALEEMSISSDDDVSDPPSPTISLSSPVSAALTAPNGLIWEQQRAQQHLPGREPARNNFRVPHVGLAVGFHPQTSLEAFKAFFGNILDLSLLHTNREGRRIAAASNVSWKPLSMTEFDAFIGLHLIAGALKAGHRDTRELWDLKNGNPIFRSAMSFQRFQQIKAALRFDNRLRRDRTDPLAPIREVVELLNSNLKKHYEPGSLLCVDEQLIEFHGRVRFQQYLRSKPGKFGIKIFWLTDTENSFPLRCLVYVGKETLPEAEREGPISEAVVLHLSRSYLGAGRNITMDNWFTSVNLCDRLAEAQTSVVGTIRSNRRGVPLAAKSTQGRTKGDSKHFVAGQKVLCSYFDKGNAPVLLLSTKHTYGRHNDGEKPEIVTCYNATKSGVDNLDKLVRTYRSQRKCRRWPYGVFMALVDVAVIASMKSMQALNHYSFKMDVGYEMTLPLVRQRSVLPRLSKPIKLAMELVGVEVNHPRVPDDQQQVRQRCRICLNEGVKERKTRFRCAECSIFICLQHAKTLYYCHDCV